MKLWTMFAFAVFFFVIGLVPSSAQVTNATLTIQMNPAPELTWDYDLPMGDTCRGEIWIDLNVNGIIDVSVDKFLHRFIQVDGITTEGDNQFPDLDEIENGHVYFTTTVGLAAATYLITFTNQEVGPTMNGTVFSFFSSPYTLRGTVTPPSGVSQKNILLQANTEANIIPNFWLALTDSVGKYIINLPPDANGVEWHIQVDDQFAPNVPTPAQRVTVVSGHMTDLDFAFVTPSATLSGYLKDEEENPLTEKEMYIQRLDGSGPGGQQYRVRTNGEGFFNIGFLAADVADGKPWRIAQPYREFEVTTSLMLAVGTIGQINSGNNLTHDLVAYKTNSTISGTVTIDGAAPAQIMRVFAVNNDSGEALIFTDAQGEFSIPVSNKIYNYDLQVRDYQGSGAQIVAHPGQTGIVINLTPNAVKERASGIPQSFTLKQNYPNPFNPSTVIDYDLPAAARVRLSIHNVIGQEVARLVDEYQPAGKYTASFDAAQLPSGVYFYKLAAGKYSTVQKMMLVR